MSESALDTAVGEDDECRPDQDDVDEDDTPHEPEQDDEFVPAQHSAFGRLRELSTAKARAIRSSVERYDPAASD